MIEKEGVIKEHIRRENRRNVKDKKQGGTIRGWHVEGHGTEMEKARGVRWGDGKREGGLNRERVDELPSLL